MFLLALACITLFRARNLDVILCSDLISIFCIPSTSHLIYPGGNARWLNSGRLGLWLRWLEGQFTVRELRIDLADRCLHWDQRLPATTRWVLDRSAFLTLVRPATRLRRSVLHWPRPAGRVGRGMLMKHWRANSVTLQVVTRPIVARTGNRRCSSKRLCRRGPWNAVLEWPGLASSTQGTWYSCWRLHWA